MDGEFCVVCGRTDVPLSDGLCVDCFAARTPLATAPEAPTLVMCPTCGARKVGQHWERAGADPGVLTGDDLTPLVVLHPEVGLRKAVWEETVRDPAQRTLHGELLVRFRGTERRVGVDLVVKLKANTCPECSRLSGHFYTATIQVRGMSERLRGPPRALRERLEATFEGLLPELKPDWRKAMSWREELPEGWNYYLTDTLAARSVARFAKSRLNATLKESATLWGRRNGQDVYRVTFCLRIPDRAPPRGPAAVAAAPVERHV
jgi:nonsense-mediated mRNA decay protein 3